MTDLENYLEEEASDNSLDDAEQELVPDGGRENQGVQDYVLTYGFSAKQGMKDLKDLYFWNAGTINGALLTAFGSYEFAVSGGSEGAEVAAAGLTIIAADQAAKTTY